MNDETTKTLRNLCCLVAPQMADVIRHVKADALPALAMAIETAERYRLHVLQENVGELSRVLVALGPQQSE